MFKKILLASAVALALAGGISFARADECQYASFEKFKADAEAVEGSVMTQLSDGDVTRVLEKLGRPPNAKEDSHLTMHLILQGDMAAIFVFEEGCLINRMGPAPKYIIMNLFGQVEADPFLTRPVLRSLLKYAAS